MLLGGSVVDRQRAIRVARVRRAFLTAAADDRIHAAWRLTLYGLRRAEACGLRWSDVDLAAGTITITQTRPVVEGAVIVKAPKSRRGVRTLPMDAELVVRSRHYTIVRSRKRWKQATRTNRAATS